MAEGDAPKKPKRETIDVEIEGRTLTLSNQSKVLYPEAGFTKGQVVDYYRRIAPVLLPHLRDRPLTLKRYPNGVGAMYFFEKNATKSRPEWVRTVPIWGHGRGADLHYLLCDDTATLVFAANLAALELHPSLSCARSLETPTMVVFDLDPGPPADLVTCCKAALVFRALFETMGLQSVAKTSGNKGMQLYVPLNTPHTHEHASSFALAVAQLLEKRLPRDVVSVMAKAARGGKVFIDWSQNSRHKTTIAVYSLRGRDRPTVSTPLTWDEVDHGADGEPLEFETVDVLARVATHGDLFAEVVTREQHLPNPSR